MDLMADQVETRPEWLASAFTALSRLPIDSCMDAGVKKTAYDLAESIEADCIPAPHVRRSRGGTIHILFVRGDNSVEFIVARPKTFMIYRYSRGGKCQMTDHRGWPGEAARDAIRWLYPTSHMTDEKGMDQVLREGL